MARTSANVRIVEEISETATKQATLEIANRPHFERPARRIACLGRSRPEYRASSKRGLQPFPLCRKKLSPWPILQTEHRARIYHEEPDAQDACVVGYRLYPISDPSAFLAYTLMLQPTVTSSPAMNRIVANLPLSRIQARSAAGLHRPWLPLTTRSQPCAS